MASKKTRVEEIAERLAALSPYSVEEAGEIIEAIAACMPQGYITTLLKCSPRWFTKDEMGAIVVLEGKDES